MKLIGIIVVLACSIACGGETATTNQPAALVAIHDSTNSIHGLHLATAEYDRVSTGFGSIHKGMTEDQVQRVIGPPSSKGKNDSGWIWRFTNVGTADEEVYVVFFTNSVVAEMNHVKSSFTANSAKTNVEPQPPAYRR